MSRFINPWEQWINAAGNPYAFGQVRFGLPNQDPTNNPKQPFSDQALNTAISAVQVLDDKGMFITEIFLKDNYSASLFDASGNQIKTSPLLLGTDSTTTPVSNVDDLRAVTGQSDGDVITLIYNEVENDGGGGQFYFDADSTENDDNGIVIDPTAAGVGRWLRIQLDPFVNVIWYGVTGDGIEDDTTALSAALATGRIVVVTDDLNLLTTVEPDWERLTGSGSVTFEAITTSLKLATKYDARQLLLSIASQGCTEEFARSVNVGSIFCDALGNTTGNYSSRLCVASHEEAVNIASEDCEAYGQSRDVNIAGKTCFTHGNGAVTIAARRGRVSGDESAVIGSDTCQTGNGYGLKTTVNISGGVVTSVTVNSGGAGFFQVPDLIIVDKSGNGSGALITATLSGDAVASIAVDNGGSGYTVEDPLQVIVKMNDGETIGTNGIVIGSESVTIRGTRTVVNASNASTVTGDRVVISASENCDAEGTLQEVVGSSGSLISAAARSVLLASKNCELADPSAIGGGTSDNTLVPSGVNQNLKWRISSQTGEAEFVSLIINGADYMSGTGSPESVLSAPVGSIYTDKSGGVGSTLYVKELGTGNLGWASK